MLPPWRFPVAFQCYQRVNRSRILIASQFQMKAASIQHAWLKILPPWRFPVAFQYYQKVKRSRILIASQCRMKAATIQHAWLKILPSWRFLVAFQCYQQVKRSRILIASQCRMKAAKIQHKMIPPLRFQLHFNVTNRLKGPGSWLLVNARWRQQEFSLHDWECNPLWRFPVAFQCYKQVKRSRILIASQRRMKAARVQPAWLRMQSREDFQLHSNVTNRLKDPRSWLPFNAGWRQQRFNMHDWECYHPGDFQLHFNVTNSVKDPEFWLPANAGWRQLRFNMHDSECHDVDLHSTRGGICKKR